MKCNRIFVIIIGLVATIGFCFIPAFAEMDNPMSSIESEDGFMVEEPGEDLENSDGAFGLGMQYTWIPIFSFVPAASATSYNWTDNNYRYFTGNTNRWMVASINLPSGAYLSSARFYYYDNHALMVGCFINRHTMPNVYDQLAYFYSSGTPGWGSANLSIGETIRNGDGNYSIYLYAGAASSNLKVGGVRLYWRREVRTGLSNPFDDIGHLNSRFQNAIKAMAASGITKGCDSNSFCPGQAVNRGQMAVFLAEALGLHWHYPY